jgi:molybdate transport system substrate-binding protein
VLEKIGADFERRSGRKLSVTTDVAVRMVRRINDGEQFDFLVAAPAQIDELIKAGKIIPETRTDLARSGIGVAVRAGAPKPDVSSVDAFKRALLTARSIAYLKEGQSGVYVAGVLERLGIAETIRSKVTLHVLLSRRECLLVDIRDEHCRSGRRERACDLETDSGRRTRDKDSLIHDDLEATCWP